MSEEAPSQTLLGDLERCLDEGRIDAASDIVAAIVNSKPEFRRRFGEVAEVFASRSRSGLLYDLVLSRLDRKLIDVSEVAAVLRLGVRPEPDQLGEFSRLTAGKINISPLRINIAPPKQQRLPGARYLRSAAARSYLTALKYGDCPPLDDTRQIFDFAASIADRLAVAQKVLDPLWEVSRYRHMAKEDWSRQIKTSFAIEAILGDLTSAEVWASIIGGLQQRLKEVLDFSHPSVILASHCGYRQPLIYARKDFEDWTVLALGRDGGRAISVQDGVKVALFSSLRALQGGKTIFIAPDGAQGAATSTIEVLGNVVPVGKGAAFLAYETRVPTNWLAIGRNETEFVPIVTAGPRCAEGESYASFTRRLHDFYASQIQSLLTGDPKNIFFDHYWSNVAAAAR